MMWWQNFKLQLIIFFIVAVVIFIISLVACGGFTFPKCKGKKKSKTPEPKPNNVTLTALAAESFLTLLDQE